MRIERPLVPTAMLFVFTGAVLACGANTQGTSSGGSKGAGGNVVSGGTTEKGGTGGSGGGTGSGGTIATGGASAAGGSLGSGGTRATGGAPGTGGSSGSAGVTSTGGTSATGGSKAAGGAAGNGSGGGGGTAVTGETSGNGGTVGGGGTVGNGGTVSTGGTVGSGGMASSGGTVSSGGMTGTGGGTTSVDCTDTSTTKLSFTKQYENGSIAVTGSTKTYYTMTNWWHKFQGQTVTLNGLSMAVGNSGGASVPASDGNPMGFPSIFVGSYQGHTTVGSNLPKQVSALKSVPTIFSTNASTLDTSNFNATYDVWFTASGTPLGTTTSNPGKGGAYLMVWLYKPADRQPRGGVPQTTGTQPNYPAQTVVGLPGTWDVWVDKTDPLCISYVSSTPLDALSFDLNNFIQDSVTNSYGITTSMYLSIVFAGFEIWSGGDGLQNKQFCAAVN